MASPVHYKRTNQLYGRKKMKTSIARLASVMTISLILVAAPSLLFAGKNSLKLSSANAIEAPAQTVLVAAKNQNVLTAVNVDKEKKPKKDKKHDPPAPATPSVAVHFCSNDPYNGSVCDPVNNAFDINTTRDVTILSELSNVTGAHTEELRFILPNGDLYQSMTTTFDTTTGQGLQPDTELPTVSNILPVAGTWIQMRAIRGAWTVQVYLDGQLMNSYTLNFF